MLFHLGDEAQGNRLDGRAGITGDRGLAVDDRHGREAFKVKVRDGLDGVDCRDAFCTGMDGGNGRDFHVADVGCHFGEYGQACRPADGFGILRDEFGALADVGTHCRGGHLRAGKIAFDDVGTDVGHFLRKGPPFIVVAAHDGRDHDLVRVVAF